MQDLVGVGVADSREQSRRGQGAFQRVVLGAQAGREVGQATLQDLDASRVVLRQRVVAAHDVQRGALLGARFGEHQRAAREIEAGQAYLAGNARASIVPAEPAGDHEVEYEKQVVLQGNHDSLAEALDAGHHLAVAFHQRRVEGAQQERAGDARAKQRLTRDSVLQALCVDGYIGQLGH